MKTSQTDSLTTIRSGVERTDYKASTKLDLLATLAVASLGQKGE